MSGPRAAWPNGNRLIAPLVASTLVLANRSLQRDDAAAVCSRLSATAGADGERGGLCAAEGCNRVPSFSRLCSRSGRRRTSSSFTPASRRSCSTGSRKHGSAPRLPVPAAPPACPCSHRTTCGIGASRGCTPTASRGPASASSSGTPTSSRRRGRIHTSSPTRQSSTMRGSSRERSGRRARRPR